MGNPAVKLATPTAENRTVVVSTPLRRPNSELRTREYLTPAEVDRLVGAAKSNRWGDRDGTMVLVAYRHGFRSTELVDLRWDQVDFTHSTIHVRRAKGGKPAAHPLQGDVMRALRRLRKDNPHGEFVFMSERGAPFSEAGWAKMIERLGREAGFTFKLHPHMLRHSTGYKLANDGKDTRSIQDYLGHQNIRHTVRYTELSPTRFKDFWR
jgi:integrase